MPDDQRGITRRRLMGAVAGTVGGSLVLERAMAQDGTPDASPVSGEWTFTDDRGVTVTLPKRPERIVADLSAAAPLWDFGIRPLAVAGFTTTTEIAWGNVDRDTPVINAESGNPDAEALVALQAELYVTITWRPDEKDSLWGFSDADVVATMEKIVPIVAISATGRADTNMERFAELAGLLGVDQESPELVEAKAGYDAAVADFTATAAKTSDLTNLFAYIPPEDVWDVANPPAWADLAFYQSLGMNMIVPEGLEEGSYWEELSREQALAYPADVLFNSTREGISTPEQLKADPVFSAHPAVAAGQIGYWNQDFIMSYQGLTAALVNMTETLKTAKKVTWR